MALRTSWPSANGLTTHAHARRDLEGAVVRNTAGKMRPGVFPAHHNPLYTRRNDMRLDIPDFRGVQDKGGPAWIAGEGATTTPAFAAAPAANKRIDLLYLTQELPGIDPTTEVGFFIEPGVTSPSPSLPALPAARADAIPWLSVEIPAGATSMQSAGVIIKELYPYTAMAGGTVVVRDLIELAAWTPPDGSRAFCLADNSDYVRLGGVWVPGAAGVSVTTTTATATPGAAGAWGAVPWSTTVFERGEMHSSAQPTRLIAPVSGVYQASATLRLVTTSYAGGVAFAVDGVVDERSAVYALNAGSFASARPHTSKAYKLSAGQYVEIMCAGQASSLSLDLAGCSASMVKSG